MKTLCRIISYDGRIYVYTGYVVHYTSDKGRLITRANSVSQGMKPARLNQFTPSGGLGKNKEFEIVCTPQNLDRCLGFFLRKTKLERVTWRPCPDHPLDNLFAETAKKRKVRGK